MKFKPAVLALLAALALAQTAGAAGAELRVAGADVSSYPTVRLSVVTPTATNVPPSLRENGQRVFGFEAENLARAKSILLAIDRSQSMEGTAFADAVRAARSFIGGKSGADRVGVVAFGKQAVRLTGFTSSTIDADAALGSLTVDDDQGTALYDAVSLGARALGAEPFDARVLIVLTDGDDTSSRASLERAAAHARRAGTAVYAIGIEGTGFTAAPLQELARTTGGGYFGAASTSALTQIYSSIAEQLRRTWRLTYLSAAAPGESANISVAAGGQTARYALEMPGDKATVTTSAPRLALPAVVYQHNVGTMLLSLFTGTCMIIAVGLLLSTPGGTRLRRRLEPHVARKKRREKITPRERFAAASGVMLATEKSLGHLKLWRRLHRLLERADLPLRTVEFVYICAGSGLLLGLFTAVAAASSFAILIAMVVGAFGPVVVVWWKAKRRLTAIDDQLPDLLITIAASLKAGHSFRQGLQAVVDEGMPPASDEFKRVLTETSLGRPMDDALAEMAERIGSKNLDFVITAVTIQRQVGGSLAGIFDMVADAVRQRQQFARKIRSLTAMGRMSAYTLCGIPFFLAGALTLLNRDYMAPLYSTSTGHMLIVVGLVMMTMGSLILRKIVAFRG